MSYQVNPKSGEIIIEGWEKGIGTSPHTGIGNIQAGNISTEPGEVMVNFARVQMNNAINTATGTITPINGSTQVDLDIVIAGISATDITAGIPITIGASTITGITGGTKYWIKSNTGGVVRLSATPNGSTLTFTAGGTSATFTFTVNMTKPIARAIEPYNDGTTQQYRYFILDSQGALWVYDTALVDPTIKLGWYLPDWTLVPNASGMAVLNGWIMIFTSSAVYVKQTVWLDQAWSGNTFLNLTMLNIRAPHFAFVGHQNILYYTDGNKIGSIFPDNALPTGATNANTQSYCKYTAVTTTGTVAAVLGGALPSSSGDATGLPAVPAWFFSTGTKPTAITVGTLYWIVMKPLIGTFAVYPTVADAIADTNKIDMQTGASGNQYFNTFWPLSSSGLTAITVTNIRLTLPFFEQAQYIAELGNQIIFGCKNNILYPWDQLKVTATDLIPLPENDVANMITVNNMLYVFAGNKGNIYVTNGSTASLALTIPDYCAGIAGTPSSYIEPYFTWGDAMYCRGRVWFSILDQVAAVGSFFQAKAGNCGGIWSFVPTQNFFYGQDTGIGLRLENQNSYGTYSGYATILLPEQIQTDRGAQYFTGWQSSVTSPTYGIDGSSTGIITSALIETDLISTGTLLQKKTFSQIEFKLSAPLTAGQTVGVKYRQNSTDGWTSCGTMIMESTTALSGYVPINFDFTENVTTGSRGGQWLQLQVTLNCGTSGIVADTSFVRLKRIIIR